MHTVLTICQIFTGALAFLDYFIPKTSIQLFEQKIRAWIERNASKIESLGRRLSRYMPWLLLTVVGLALFAWFSGYAPELSAHYNVGSQAKLASHYGAFLYSSLFIVATLFVLSLQIEAWFLMFVWFLQFAAWCPKGVIAGISLPAFLIITIARIFG